MSLLLESQEQRKARLLNERMSLLRAASESRKGKRKSFQSSILQTGEPTKVLSLCVLNEQNELEKYLDKVRRTERTVTDMDDLDQAYTVLVEDVI